jgi:hypothetical protein
MGDMNGSQHITSADALWVLGKVARLPLPMQGIPCSPEDVDCNGIVSSVDALKILRHIAGLTSPQVEPCVDIGSPFPL